MTTKSNTRPPRLTAAANRAFRARTGVFFPILEVPKIARALLAIKSHLRTPERFRAWTEEHFVGTRQDVRDCLLIFRKWETKKLKRAIAQVGKQSIEREDVIRAVAALLRGD